MKRVNGVLISHRTINLSSDERSQNQFANITNITNYLVADKKENGGTSRLGRDKKVLGGTGK